MISEIFPEYAEKFSSSYGKIHVAGKIYDEKDLYITSNSSVELQNLYDRRSNLLKDFKCSLDILPKLGNPEAKLKCYRNLVKLEEQIIAILLILYSFNFMNLLYLMILINNNFSLFDYIKLRSITV